MADITLKYASNFIWLFIPFVLLVVLTLGYKRKKSILLQLQVARKSVNEIIGIIAMIIGILLISIGLLGPQKLIGTYQVKQESLDIYILLDTSKSMLTEDIVPSRIAREKEMVQSILDGLKGDRVGFIPFASSPYIQMPLTDDYNMAGLFLDVVDTDMIGGGGSDVGLAIELAEKSFSRTTQGNKVILIISDGEEHDTKSLEALKKIKDDRLKVYSIGVGTKDGGLIPLYDPNGIKTGYKKDSAGNSIMSKLQDDTLKQLAKVGGGQYYTSTTEGNEIQSFLSSIATLKKDANKSAELNQYQHLFPYFLGIGLLLFLIGYFIPVRRRKP